MKKRILSILLAFVMIIGIMPAHVFAKDNLPSGDYGSFVDGSKVLEDMIEKCGTNVHPRIIMTEDKFAELRTHVGEKSVTGELLEELRGEADNYLKKEIPEYDVSDDDFLLETSKRVQRYIATLALAYNIFEEEKYATGCYAVMDAACDYDDWDPYHFLDTAELCTGVAFGYDWLYNCMTPEQRKKIKDALIEKGLKQVMEDYKDESRSRSYEWYQDEEGDNWQLVCTGGTNLAALAIGDEEGAEEISAQVITYGYKRAYEFVRRAYSAPDGTYLEGLGYWDYATYYLGLQSSALISTTGTDYGLADYEGIERSAEFIGYMSSNIPKSFSYGDDGDSRDTGWTVFLWLGQHLNSPELSAIRQRKIAEDGEFRYLDVLWIEGDGEPCSGKNNNATDWASVGARNASFRDTWDISGIVAALHTGENNYTYHGHYDLGSFYIESNGERFFTDLGNENYKLTDRQFSYRIKAEGHNTLVINPTKDIDQCEGVTCLITDCKSGNEAYAVTDLTEAYKDNGAKSVVRGLQMIKDQKCVVIQDEISLNVPGEIYWFAHTRGEISVAKDGKSAVVEVGNERLWVGLMSESGKFTAMDAKPLSTSKNVPGATENTGYRKLAIHLENTKDTTISVACIPLKKGETSPSWTPAVKSLSEWSSGDCENHNFVNIGNGEHKCSVCETKGKHDFINGDGTCDSTKAECSLCGAKNINYSGLNEKIVSNDIEYTGKALAPDVSVTGLIEGTDYTVEEVTKTEPGEYKVKIIGKGNYFGEREVKWKIVAGAPSLTLPSPSGTYK